MRNVKSIPFRLLLTLAATLLLSGCKVLPVVPTLAVIPTRITDTATTPPPTSGPVLLVTQVPSATPAATTAIPAASATIGPLPGPAATAQVTYGPVSLTTAIPSLTLAVAPSLAPITLPTSADTPIPILVTNTAGNSLTFTITEAQLNAALIQSFAVAPIAGYTQPPRAALGDGSLDLHLDIIPTTVQANALTMTLTTQVVAYEGLLETRPTHLEPLNAGVTTRQVKPGQALLQQAFAQLARQAANGLSFTYATATVHPQGVTITLATTPR